MSDQVSHPYETTGKIIRTLFSLCRRLRDEELSPSFRKFFNLARVESRGWVTPTQSQSTWGRNESIKRPS